MKRLHVNLAVDNLADSVGFYNGLFGTAPTVLEHDYAKWMLDDPRVNFAIATRGRKPGLDHLGIQVEDEAELTEVYGRLKESQGRTLEQGGVTCCYAKSEKSWVFDPQGIAWEAFLTRGQSTIYGEDTPTEELEAQACCAAECCA